MCLSRNKSQLIFLKILTFFNATEILNLISPITTVKNGVVSIYFAVVCSCTVFVGVRLWFSVLGTKWTGSHLWMWLSIFPVCSTPVTSQVPLQDMLLTCYQRQRHLPWCSEQLKIKPNHIKAEINILELLQYLHCAGNYSYLCTQHELCKS